MPASTRSSSRRCVWGTLLLVLLAAPSAARAWQFANVIDSTGPYFEFTAGNGRVGFSYTLADGRSGVAIAFAPEPAGAASAVAACIASCVLRARRLDT